MVFIAGSSISWRSLLHTWTQSIEEQHINAAQTYTHSHHKESWWKEHITIVTALAGWLLPPTLEFLHARCHMHIGTQELALIR